VTPTTQGVVLYDGVCGFCDRSVQWLLEADQDNRLRYAPLQGPTAAALRERHPLLPVDIDTVVLVEGEGADERLYLRSDAVLRIASLLPRVPGWVQVFRWCPRPLRDALYKAFAAIRYRVWGKLDACRLPTQAERARFLP
jgi:predicted DCC family thiol-disulfide oxidoreductase YuxK